MLYKDDTLDEKGVSVERETTSQFIFRTRFDENVLILGRHVVSARSSNKVLHLYTLSVRVVASVANSVLMNFYALE